MFGNMGRKGLKLGELAFHAAGVKEIIDFVKNLAKNKDVQGKAGEYVLKKITGKGLTDEGLFAEALVLAKNLIKINKQKKISAIRKAMRKIAEEDKTVGTKHAQNIRLIVLSADIGRGGEFLWIPKKDSDGNVVGAVKISTPPNQETSSSKILADMAEECWDPDEYKFEYNLLTYLYSVGAFQDAPMGSLDEFQFWLKKNLYPKIPELWDKLGDEVILGLADVLAGHQDKVYGRRKRAHELKWLGENDGVIKKICAPFKKLFSLAFWG